MASTISTTANMQEEVSPIASVANTDMKESTIATVITSTVASETKNVPMDAKGVLSAPVKPLSVVYLQSQQKIAPKQATTSASALISATLQNVRLKQSQPVFLKKASTSLKSNIAYITMLKPVNKSENTTIGTLTHFKPENVQVSAPQKYVISSLPKFTQNRVAVTATTNSVTPKFTLLPLTIPNNPKQIQNKVINLKITDGQVQNDNNGSIRIMQSEQPSLICNEVLDGDVSYQISIAEETNKPHTVSILKKNSTSNLTQPIESNQSYKSLLQTFTTISDATTKEVTISTEPDFHPISDSVATSTPPPTTLATSPPPIPPTILSTSTLIDIMSQNMAKSEKTHDKLSVKPYSNVDKNANCNLLKNNISDTDDNRNKIRLFNGIDKNADKLDSNLNKISLNLNKRDEKLNPKPERRRKSTVLIRKDFNVNEEPDIIIDESSREEIEEIEEKPEIEPPEPKTEYADFKMNEDYDVLKALSWDDGIGSLPGTNLKFQLNEFGFLEYLTNADFRKIYTKKLQNQRLQQLSTSLQDGGEEMRCLECGCYGMPADFISPKYCSFDCQKSGDKKTNLLRQLATANYLTGIPQTLADINQSSNAGSNNGGAAAGKGSGNGNGGKVDGRKKRKLLAVATAEAEAVSVNGTDGSRSDEDQYQYPWTCSKKGFSWSKYLTHTNSKAAPLRLFKDPFPYQRNGFRLGMKLEGIDPQHPGTFCVLSVAAVRGYRIRVHLDGYSDEYDYWLNADSLHIFPAGYCEKHGYHLRPPPPYTEVTFSWTVYLKDTKCTAAYKQIMANRPQFLPTNFRAGQKLEAVDRKNSNLICVASVANIMDNRILVHFDSWDDIYDYWADPSSPYIHPVGWTDQNGHNLTPPNDYPDPETFSWDDYLRDTKSQAAPVRAFKQRPACGFKRGMKLECVDKRVPLLIRVATVDEVDEHKIKLRFDGWPAKYSYWVDDDSPDIHPVGWCSKTGHPIEPPLTPDDVYDFLECPTVGCKGVGSTRGSAHAAHTTPTHCPYADEHLHLDQWRALPDRLLSPNRRPERAVVVSREPPREPPKEKRLGRPPKNKQPTTYLAPKPDPEPFLEPEEIIIKEEPQPEPKRRRKESAASNPHKERFKNEHFLQEPEQTPEELKLYKKYSSVLDNLVKKQLNPVNWTLADVVNFVGSVPSCSNKKHLFITHHIDGKCLLMLSQEDLIQLLDFKLGPAIKLYNCILLLRKRFPICM